MPFNLLGIHCSSLCTGIFMYVMNGLNNSVLCLQFEYNDWLAALCGCPVSEEWRKKMYLEVSKNKHAQPETYRDEWEDDHLVLQAHEDFKKYTLNGVTKK